MSSAKRDDGDNEKRDIPPMIKKLLAIDVELTKKFVAFSLNFLPMRSLKTNCKLLEVRFHSNEDNEDRQVNNEMQEYWN